MVFALVLFLSICLIESSQDIKKLEDYNILLPVSSNQRFHATHI